MCDLNLLNDEEYRLLCKAVPSPLIIKYFQNNPKEFAKIKRGFRPSSIKSKDIEKILRENRNRRFISSFLHKIVDDWLEEICNAAKSCENEVSSELISYLYVLPKSFFSDNISAFFKLMDINVSEENIGIFCQIVTLLKLKNEDIEKKENELKTFQEKFRMIETQLNKEKQGVRETKEKDELISQLIKVQKKQEDCISVLNDEKREMSQTIKENENLISHLQDNQKKHRESIHKAEEEINANLRLIKEKDDFISQLEEKINILNDEKNSLEDSIRRQIKDEEEKVSLSIKYNNPVAPKDLSEFRDYFKYNIESLDLNTRETEIKELFCNYIVNIFFRGRPIICNQLYSSTLIQCVSNTIAGTTQVPIIQYSQNLDQNRIMSLIQMSGRIVVLENFLGNYNESILISNLQQFKDKIIILTFMYEGTLKYLSNDLFSYCNFLDLSGFPSLSRGVSPKEDPSTLEEEECMDKSRESDNRFSTVLKNIMKELNFTQQVTRIKITDILREEDMLGALYFDVLPYFRYVYEDNPLHYSQTLQKQLSKSSYKILFEEWINS